MGKFEERELKYQHICWTCKHYVSDDDDEDHAYCLLDLSKEEKQHVYDSFWNTWDDKTFELLKIDGNGDWYDSGRRIEPDCVCQFWELNKWEDE